MQWVVDRLDEGNRLLQALLSSPKLAFDDSLRERLPEQHGIYAIYDAGVAPNEILWVGRTEKSRRGLRRRICEDHLAGNASSDLPVVLVRSGVCSDPKKAKSWIRGRCVVQFVVVDSPELCKWSEHFVLGILRPKYNR